MALYKVSWRFAHDATFIVRRKWSNVLYVDSPSSVAAAAAGVVAWEDTLRNGMSTNIFCYEVYATSVASGDDDFTVQAVTPGNQRGNLVSSAGDLYLPKVCLAVTLPVTGSRPSRKFWRIDLRESDIVNGITLNPAVVNAVRLAWDFTISNGAGLWRDVDGQVISGVGRIRLTTREFGRESTVDLPEPPPVG